MSLADNIRNNRKRVCLTQEELADKLGLKKQTVQKYESGIISNIPSDKIELMAKIFDTTPAELMGWNTIKAEKPALKPESEPKDAFTYAMQNECRDLTDEDKALLMSMAKQLSSARKAKNGQTD